MAGFCAFIGVVAMIVGGAKALLSISAVPLEISMAIGALFLAMAMEQSRLKKMEEDVHRIAEKICETNRNENEQ